MLALSLANPHPEASDSWNNVLIHETSSNLGIFLITYSNQNIETQILQLETIGILYEK